MNQIEDLPPTELERSLPDRLRRSASAMSPAPDALAEVRARAAARRRRTRVAIMATSAAAVVLIAVGVAVVTGDDPSTGLTAGPADGGAPASTVAPVPVPDGDATLVIYRYPNATAEMIAADPKMGGQWATLTTGDRRYHANGPLSELGADSPWEPSATRRALDLIGPAEQVTPELLIDDLLTDEYLGSPAMTIAPDQPAASEASALLIGLLMTGQANSHEAGQVRRLLESLPGTTVEESEGVVSVSAHDVGMWARYAVGTGHPLRSGMIGVPESDVEYLTVTNVRAADHLLMGRGTPNLASTTTTMVRTDVSTTTVVSGDTAVPR